MGVIAAYDMYVECCEGMLDKTWQVNNKDRMTFLQFHLKLTEQMLRYDPRDDLYAGDNKFRKSTQMPKNRRRMSKDLSAEEFLETGVTLVNLMSARRLPRFCSTIEQVQQHFHAIKKKTNPSACEVCGVSTYWKCTICNSFICLLDKRHWNGAKCAFTFHSEKFFGLARSDYLDVLGKVWENGKKKRCDEIKRELELWKQPTAAVMERHARFIARLKAQDEHEVN